MIRVIDKSMYAAKSIVGSAWTAVFVLVGAALLFSGHQEIIAQDAPYDDYYFLMRSQSFDLGGSHLGPLREYLYPLFIKISRALGFSLRNVEVICYALALTWLWVEIRKLTRSAFIAWVTVFPLAIFTYQSPVFNATEYDALQLVLTPLTIASAIMIFRTRGNAMSLGIAGLVAAAQVLTRPEGMMFLAPPLVAIAFVALASDGAPHWRIRGLRFLGMAVVVCIIPVLAQQGMSAVNYAKFGFWAPTMLKSSEFKGALTALMSIRPANNAGGRYAPVPVSAIEQAYRASPAFRKAEEYLSRNLGGQGWSAWAPPGYGTHDGSIDGGHFPFALVEASAYAAGSKPRDMVAYLATVTQQLDSAFERGELSKRHVLSPSLGPNFSLLSPHYWRSFWHLTRLLLDLGNPAMPFGKPMPGVAYRWKSATIEANYDFLALRRTALLYANDWKIAGWILDRKRGLPDRIALDQQALIAGVGLKLVERPDVAKSVLGLTPAQAPKPLVGYELSVPDAFRDDLGAVQVTYGDAVTRIPIARFIANHGTAFSEGMVEIQEEQVIRPLDLLQAKGYLAARLISSVANRVMSVVFIIATLLLVVQLAAWKWCDAERVRDLALVAGVAFAIALPRLAMLAAIDAFMFPGQPPRYLAAGAFAMWFFALFVMAQTLHDAGSWFRMRVARLRAGT